MLNLINILIKNNAARHDKHLPHRIDYRYKTQNTYLNARHKLKKRLNNTFHQLKRIK